MADQNKKTNKKALTGFMLVILSPVLLVLFMCCYRYIRGAVTGSIVTLIISILGVLLPLAGRFFAVIGLISSIIKREKGKKLAIAAIIISVIEVIVYFLYAVLVLFAAANGDSRPPVR